MSQRSRNKPEEQDWDLSFDTSFAPFACSTPKKSSTPSRNEYYSTSTPRSQLRFDEMEYSNNANFIQANESSRSKNFQQSTPKPEYSKNTPPIRPISSPANSQKYGSNNTNLTSNYRRPITVPPNSPTYGKPVMGMPNSRPQAQQGQQPTYQAQLGQQPVYQTQLGQQPVSQPQPKPQYQPRPESSYPSRQYSASPSPSRYPRQPPLPQVQQQSPYVQQQSPIQRQPRPQTSPQSNPALYTPPPKVTRTIVYETKYNPQAQTSSTETDIWAQMKNIHQMHKDNLRRQQALERQNYPNNNTYLREKHSIEEGELDVEYQKNRLKLMHKLQYNLDTTPTDEQIFGTTINESRGENPSTYRHPDTTRRQTTPAHSSPSTSTQQNTPRSETIPMTPRRLDFSKVPEPVTEPYQRQNNTMPKIPLPPQRDKSPSCKSKCDPCSSNVGKMEQINHAFITDARKTLISALFRRMNIKSTLEKCVTAANGHLDCRQKKTQQAAVHQMEINFDTEISSIYHELLLKRQKIAQGENPYDSIDLSTDDVDNLERDSTDDDKTMAEAFAQTIIEAVDEDSIKVIAINEESRSFSQSDMDNVTIIGFQEDCKRMIDQMEDDFIALWKEFESVNCRRANNSSSDELTVQIGNAMLDIYSIEMKLLSEFEKNCLDECIGCRDGNIKQVQDADRQELKKTLVDLANDMWDAMGLVKTILKSNTNHSMPNCNTVLRAMLAICRKYVGSLKEMLTLHRNKRRLHQEESLTNIFDFEWIQLQSEMNEELTNIISSLHYGSNSRMSCQEKRLKSLQQKEKQALIEKYHKQENMHPCRVNDLGNKLNEELTELNHKHLQQWNTMVDSKLQRKIEQIEKIFPRESKEACVQTCSKKMVKNMPKIVEDESDGETLNCGCKKNDNSSVYKEEGTEDNDDDDDDDDVDGDVDSDGDNDNEEEHNFDGNQSSSSSRNATKARNLPDLEELSNIEDEELTELQNNLRQWQLARRSLLESINRSLK